MLSLSRAIGLHRRLQLLRRHQAHPCLNLSSRKDSSPATVESKTEEGASIVEEKQPVIQARRIPFGESKADSEPAGRQPTAAAATTNPIPERVNKVSLVDKGEIVRPVEHASGQSSNDLFGRILQRFPKSGRSLSFAYGSGVFKQAGRSERGNVTDLILVVEDATRWHEENLKMNRSDYSAIFRLLGPKVISDNQDHWGARLTFNTLIPFEDGLIKYGVISRQALLADCLDWEHLYASGRLHKPVRILEMDPVSDAEMTTSLRLNLQSAMHTSLLLLPESFTEENLYLTLAGLSYRGDFRMVVGEDRNKVSNIVRPNLPRFRHLYSNRLRSLSDYVEILPSKGLGYQDSSASARHFHLSQLPRALQWNLVLEWNRDGRYRDVEEVLRSAAYDRDSDELILRALRKIVLRSSVSQAAKGILTAGPVKTVKYSLAKLAKMYMGFRKGSSFTEM